jgi:DNA-binding MarR family transcriptional regulator
VLEQFGQLTLIELGERLVCETGSPSRLVNGMVSAGYVTKTPDPLDGRAVKLSLAYSAKAIMPHLNAIEDAYNDAVLEQAKALPVPFETALEVLHTLVDGTPAGRAVELRKAHSSPQ